MASEISLEAQENRCPLWALAAPGLYLLACFAAVRAVLVERVDVGIAGILIAVGLVPAFAIPAIFTTRRARLLVLDGALSIDGMTVKVDDARVDRGARGSGVLHLTMRSGKIRSFTLDSYKDAQRIIAMLPPVSAPAGALAVRA